MKKVGQNDKDREVGEGGGKREVARNWLLMV